MNGSIKRVMATILVVVLLLTNVNFASVVNAYEFFGSYTDVAKIYDSNSCPSMQGLAVGSQMMYAIKIKTDNTRAVITMTDKDTGEITTLTDASTGYSYFTGLDHANDMAVWGIDGASHIFVATTLKGSNAIVRYKRSGSKLSKVATYHLQCNGSDICATAMDVMKVDSSGYIHLITKWGMDIYTGKVHKDTGDTTIAMTKLCTIDKSMVYIKNEKLNLSNWVNQGFGYHDNTLFVPLSGPESENALHRSVVLVYDLDDVIQTGCILYPTDSIAFRVTSSSGYPALFEIESVDICSGDNKLYFSTNRRKTTSDTNHDGISYFQGYTYTKPADASFDTVKHFFAEYLANGGTGTMAVQRINTGVSTALSANAYTKTGYAFAGWTAHRLNQNQWYYCLETDRNTTAWYAEGSEPDGYIKYVYNNQQKVAKTSNVHGDTVQFVAQWKPIDYTVTWNINGQQYAQTTARYGDTLTAPAYSVPTGYSFSGWNVPATMPAQNITLEATSTLKHYTITWKDDNGTTLGTTTVEHGGLPTYPDPAKAADGCTTYTFAGWNEKIVAATGNTTYTATYTTGTSHTGIVTDAAVDPDCTNTGLTQGSHCETCGEVFTAQEEVPANGHSFVNGGCENCDAEIQVSLPGSFNGWDTSAWIMTRNEDGTYTYQTHLEAKTYTFKVIDNGNWLGNNGTIGDHTYGYEWIFGDAGDCTLSASGGTYTFTYNINTKGLKVECEPDHVHDYGMTYTWSDYYTACTASGVCKDSTCGDSWSASCTITSGLEDGKLSFTATCGQYTDTVTVDADTTDTIYVDVSRYDWTNVNAYCWSSQGHGEMVSWPGTAMTHISGSVYALVVPADFDMIIFNNGSSQTTDLNMPTNGENIALLADGNVKWGHMEPATYTVTFVSDGATVDTQYVAFGGMPVKPANPTKGQVGCTVYTFAGWDKELTTVFGNASYTATYTEKKSHTAETVSGYDATCTKTGLTDGVKCSVCGEILTAQEVIPSLGHTEETVPGYEATCTKTGLTDGVKCSVCGEILTAQEVIPSLGHQWTDATCTAPKTCGTCGATDGAPLTHVDADKSGRCDACKCLMAPAALMYHSLSLKGNIGINYYMLLSDEVLADSTAYMQFTLADGEVRKVLVGEGVPVVRGEETYYVFSCAVDAKEMTDDVVARFFYQGGSTAKDVYNVKAYADYILSVSTKDSLKNLVAAMLNYGAASQNHFVYRTDDLANVGLEAPDYSGVAITGFTATAGQGTELAKLYSASLILKSETTLRFFFKLDADVENFTATYHGQALEVKQRSGLYYVDVVGISAKDLDANVTITIHDGTGTADVSFNPMAYCQGVQNDNTGTFGQDMKDVVAALYLYNQAANTYFKEI